VISASGGVAAKPNTRSVKSADRVFQLLELFESERRPLRIAEMVDHLNLPQSSVSMLVKTLVDSGYMDFNPESREYCPSVRIGFLCNWVKHLPGRGDSISDPLFNLVRTTGETVLLGRIDGFHLQYALVLPSRQELRFSPSSGTRRPLHLTAVGIMLMSALSDERIDLLLRRYNAEVASEPERADIGATLREVATARAQGFYESANLATPGVGVISKLIPTPLRGQQLAVGIGAPLKRLRQRRRQLLDQLEQVIRDF
jgi:DNA-binding IclR family transcriptional regulator